MKLFLLILILAIFIQTTFLPINLCLLLLICRSFVVTERENYYLAFFSGIVLGLLSLVNVGFYPLIFLVFVKFISLIKRSGLASHLFIILPVAFLIFLLNFEFEKLFFEASVNFYLVMVETILTLPVYFLLKFWDERFIVRPQMKLEINQK